MKRIILALTCVLALAALSAERDVPRLTASDIQMYFSPDGGATAAIVKEIGNAKRQILVQAYSFTSAPLAKALTAAHARGVSVTVILDKSQRTSRYTSATFLDNHAVPLFIDAEHAIAHNKVMIIDGEVLITGSFNFTKAAEVAKRGEPARHPRSTEAHCGVSRQLRAASEALDAVQARVTEFLNNGRELISVAFDRGSLPAVHDGSCSTGKSA